MNDSFFASKEKKRTLQIVKYRRFEAYEDVTEQKILC